MPIAPFIKDIEWISAADELSACAINVDAQGAQTIDMAHIDFRTRSDYNRAIGAIMLDANQGAEADCEEDIAEWRGHAYTQRALCSHMYRVDSRNVCSDLHDDGASTPTTDREVGTKDADTVAKIMTLLDKACQDDQLDLHDLFHEAKCSGFDLLIDVAVDVASESKHPHGSFSTWMPQATHPKWRHVL